MKEVKPLSDNIIEEVFGILETLLGLNMPKTPFVRRGHFNAFRRSRIALEQQGYIT